MQLLCHHYPTTKRRIKKIMTPNKTTKTKLSNKSLLKRKGENTVTNDRNILQNRIL